MGFRFSNRINLMPGLKLNLSKSGVSLSTGVRGAHLNLGARGLYGTVGIPGTGLSYRQWLDAPSRAYDRPLIERRLSTRQIEAQLRREQKEEHDKAAKDLIDAEWADYQSMLYFWEPLPEIPSLDDFVRAQAKRPFETTLQPPSELNWDGEAKKNLDQLADSIKSQWPYVILPGFFSNRKAQSLFPTLWPEQKEQIQNRYNEKLGEYEEHLKTAQDEWEAKENERIAWLRRLTSGDMQEVKHTVDEIFNGLLLPFKSPSHCDVLFDGADLISMNLGLPALEDIILFTRKRLLKNGETRELTRDMAERNKDYFDVVTGESTFFAAEIFSYLPLCNIVRIAAFTQRPRVKETDPIDNYIFEIHYTREGLKANSPDKTSMLSFLTHAGARFNLATDFKLVRIDRPSWLDHTGPQPEP